MAFREGELYRCSDPGCGCLLTVFKGAPPDCTGERNPTCCCGRTMDKVATTTTA